MARSKMNYTKQLMHFQECKDSTLKQIRRSSAYRQLIPYRHPGRKGKNPGKAHFGNKSSLRKEELCRALDNPKNYHKKLIKNYGTGKRKTMKNSAPRKRFSRTGLCLPLSGKNKRTAPCKGKFPHVGITTTAKKCCYAKPQSAKTKQLRKKNASKVKKSIIKYNNKLKKSTKKGAQKGTRKGRSKKTRTKKRKIN